ncbi:MAG: ABC transporter ATP-binding protein [Planctomycetota bacterium]|jgi:phospholipid/cholesterol/gamma-HCH transport system ATP-binding protein
MTDSGIGFTPDPDRPATRSGEIVIECHGVKKSYGDREILHGIDLEVRKGETLVIMGGSGHGKSTLLRLMIGAEKADAGTVALFGQDMNVKDERTLYPIKKRFGVLFQSSALYGSMTVGENIALPLEEHTDLDKKIIDIIVKLKLEQVGLRGMEGLMPSELSGGMRKRVGLARAIALDPEIIFYDEPGAGLDPVVLAQIDHLITGLSEKLGVASIVVTHEMQSAFRIADRMVLLYNGNIIAEGTPEEMRESASVDAFVHGRSDGGEIGTRDGRGFVEDLLGG